MYTDGKYDYYSDGVYGDEDYRGDYLDDAQSRYFREDSGAFDTADYDYENVNDKGIPVKRNIARDIDNPRRRFRNEDERGRRITYDDDLSHEQRARAAVSGRIRSRKIIGEDNIVRSAPMVTRSVHRDENGHIIIEHFPHPRPYSRIIDRLNPNERIISSRDADRIGDVDRADRVGDVERSHFYDNQDHIVRVPRGEKFDYRDEDGEYREHVLPHHYLDDYERNDITHR